MDSVKVSFFLSLFVKLNGMERTPTQMRSRLFCLIYVVLGAGHAILLGILRNLFWRIRIAWNADSSLSASLKAEGHANQQGDQKQIQGFFASLRMTTGSGSGRNNGNSNGQRKE